MWNNLNGTIYEMQGQCGWSTLCEMREGSGTTKSEGAGQNFPGIATELPQQNSTSNPTQGGWDYS